MTTVSQLLLRIQRELQVGLRFSVEASLLLILLTCSVSLAEERPHGENWSQARTQEELLNRAQTDPLLRPLQSLSRIEIVRDGVILLERPGIYGTPNEGDARESFVDLTKFHWLQVRDVYLDLRAARYVPEARRLIDSKRQIQVRDEAHYLIPLHFSIRYELKGARGALVDGTLNVLSRFTLGEKTDYGRMMAFETLETQNSRALEGLGRMWDGGELINDQLIQSVGHQTLYHLLLSGPGPQELEEIANEMDQQRILRESQEYIQRANKILKNPRPLLIH